MAKNGISEVLKRTLKEGKEYNKLIPRVKCERTNLGRGDTFHTTEQMKDWIEAYSFQTKKLSPLLKGRTLEGTVNNIYQFLYNHIQYQADGALQQLRSPACTWMQRKEGVDCKSFSVFASSILSNLGIKHYIRQIRQPYFHPEEFTHVYVVVPVNQNLKNYSANAATLVLDATKHQNIESVYLEKVDMPMLQHIGLNAPAPATAPVATAAQNKRTAQIVENFNAFSNFLIEKGVSKTTVNALRQEVNKYTSKGQDPKFQIVDKGIVVGGKLFPFNLNERHDGLGAAATLATTGAALMKLLPPDFIGDTFGSVFANGFNLSCWNSSTSPVTEKKKIVEIFQPFFEACFSKISGSSDLNEIERYLNMAFEASYKMSDFYCSLSNAGKYASCSREGWGLSCSFADGIISHLDTLLTGMESKFSFRKSERSSNVEYNFPKNMVKTGKDQLMARGAPQNVAYPVISNLNIKPQENTGNTNAPNNQHTGNANPEKESGSNTGLIVAGVAAAAIPLLFMMKKSPSKPSPLTPKGGTKRATARKPAARKRTRSTRGKTAKK